MRSFGASTRWWHDKHLGVQAGLTRDSMTSDVAAGRVTSMQIEPGVVYALFDRVPSYVWIRPYVGSALSFRHQTWKDTVPTGAQPISDNGVGYRVFGGGELTFASVTPLGLSAEVGYRKLPTAFAGFEPDRWSVAIAGHWYIRERPALLSVFGFGLQVPGFSLRIVVRKKPRTNRKLRT